MPTKFEIGPLEVETLRINFLFEFHRLLVLPDGIEKVLSSIKISVFFLKTDRIKWFDKESVRR